MYLTFKYILYLIFKTYSILKFIPNTKITNVKKKKNYIFF